MGMQKIIPSLWFDRTAGEAAEFYASLFPHTTIAHTSSYPSEGVGERQRAFAGELLTAELEIDGFAITLINADASFRPNQALSFLVHFDPARDPEAREHLDDLWAGLLDDGVVHMPLDEYPFSERYGWIEDRFGVSWQLMLTNPAASPQPFLTPDFLFGGAMQDRAEEALEFYTSLFADAGVGSIRRYPQQSGPAASGAVMFAEFRREGQAFAAMDSVVENSDDFTPGFSFQVMCADQDEIGRLWAALSSVPEAEQCGWCVDRFGVSWQIVPADLPALLSTPESYQAMLAMKKIVIADL